MQLREAITVQGVPFTWNTILSDDGIRELDVE
jgi:hypothetical protein